MLPSRLKLVTMVDLSHRLLGYPNIGYIKDGKGVAGVCVSEACLAAPFEELVSHLV